MNGFHVQYKRTSDEMADYHTEIATGAETRMYIINSLEPGQAYIVRVLAYNEAGKGPPSNCAEHSTQLAEGRLSSGPIHIFNINIYILL